MTSNSNDIPEVDADSRRRVLEAVATEWNRRGIRYCILHGLDNYPLGIGRDLDLLLDPDHQAQALGIARQVFGDKGWMILEPPPTWGQRLLACKDGEWSSVVELHALDGLMWRNMTICRNPHSSVSIGPFQTDPWCAFVKRILLPVLSGDIDRFDAKPGELKLSSAEAQRLDSALCQLCGKAVGSQVYNIVMDGDVSRLRQVVPSLRLAIMFRGFLKRPLGSLVNLLKLLARSVSLPFAPCGPVVALVGPDGVGKSSVLAQFQSQKSIFTRVTIRHWRPGLLPALGRIGKGRPVETPSNAFVAPRRKAGRFGFVRQIYYAFDFWLGYYLRDRVASAKQQLILYDRCLLDMTVDPLRYGLATGSLMSRLYPLLPKPDLVVLLQDDPQRVHDRKPELDVHEISRQLDLWRRLVQAGKVHAVVQVDAPQAEIADRIKARILEHWFRLPKANPPCQAA